MPKLSVKSYNLPLEVGESALRSENDIQDASLGFSSFSSVIMLLALLSFVLVSLLTFLAVLLPSSRILTVENYFFLNVFFIQIHGSFVNIS